jgi:hypothetical protein
MGEIVGAFGVPHNPHFPTWVQDGHPLAGEILTMYRPLALAFERMRPDTLLYITSDHRNMFWQTLPVFAIGVAESARGASDHPELDRDLAIDAQLAREIHTHLVHAEFDVAVLQDLELDHAAIAPLQFLMPAHRVPLIPIYINAVLRPLPSADRCQALGRAIRAAVEASPEAGRVAVAGSGSFSSELDRVLALLRAAAVDDLVTEATGERAGNAGGEVLDWIAMLGTFDPRPPDYLDVQRPFGHAFASWHLDGLVRA